MNVKKAAKSKIATAVSNVGFMIGAFKRNYKIVQRLLWYQILTDDFLTSLFMHLRSRKFQSWLWSKKIWLMIIWHLEIVFTIVTPKYL